MAAKDWAEIYDSYNAAELDAEIAALKKQKSVFSQQTVGGKSFTKDLRLLQDQLQAAIRVKNLRNADEGVFDGRVDFSGV
jgi:hypothetical protein